MEEWLLLAFLMTQFMQQEEEHFEYLRLLLEREHLSLLSPKQAELSLVERRREKEREMVSCWLTFAGFRPRDLQ